jgi:hypothetical protein
MIANELDKFNSNFEKKCLITALEYLTKAIRCAVEKDKDIDIYLWQMKGEIENYKNRVEKPMIIDNQIPSDLIVIR